ncbi:TPA: lysozyme family protein [Streptococcus agalactiae]|nr:lysozyme family protein [Streptococcus agalactiae]
MFKFLKRLIALIIIIFIGYRLVIIHENVKKVLQYHDLVQNTLAENGSEANVHLVLSMIYTETKGDAIDVMQSSESISGTTNSITDSHTSIKHGVTLLSQNISQAKKAKVDVWTAVQAYNFGSSYIDYVADHGGENSIELAKNYSKNVVAPSLGNYNGDTYFYYHPLALISGGKLYKNGCNIYYSREVQFNLYLIKIMELF